MNQWFISVSGMHETQNTSHFGPLVMNMLIRSCRNITPQLPSLCTSIHYDSSNCVKKIVCHYEAHIKSKVVK